tara:strand:- start:298 stop:717 length:420 start_codon:yes stop_codon:yes gene_type:complete
MKIIGEIPSYVVALETDFTSYCLKCKGKRGIRNEKYKVYREGQVLERSNCIDCGTILRNFRKAKYYNKSSADYGFLPIEIPDLDNLLGKKQAKIIRNSWKYHPLRSLNLGIHNLNIEPRVVAEMIISSRKRNPIRVKIK